MKKGHNVTGFLNAGFYGFCVVLATARYAFANNAPGPLAIVSIFSVVVLTVILTFAGGGYGVMKRFDDIKYKSKVKRTLMNTMEFVAGLVLFFVGVMASIFGILGFSIYAIVRGVKMIKWSKEAKKEDVRPAYLEGASPRRLMISGSMLILLTLGVLGYSVINIDEVTGVMSYKKRAYASILNSDAKNAYTAATIYFGENPKAKVVTCADLEKSGFKPSREAITCFSDMTVSSGSIRITGPDSWKLSKSTAIITYSGELTRAEP